MTAVANDVGVEEIFQRQVIAYGREGDALVALSTSGDSENVIEALAEARRRGLRDDRAASATTAAGSPPRGSPTTSSSPARRTSRGSRRRRRAPTTCSASWSSSHRRWSCSGCRAPAPSRARVEGIVQGVGFRPFVYRLATELGSAARSSTTSAAC